VAGVTERRITGPSVPSRKSLAHVAGLWTCAGVHAVASYGGDTDEVVIATKGGTTRSRGNVFGRNATMPYLREAVEKPLRNLGVEVIDLYQSHRPDRSMVYADAISNFKTLRDERKIMAVGISNANVGEIQIAVDVLGEGGLVSVQNEFSPKFCCSEDELDFCAERGIAFCPGVRSMAPVEPRTMSASVLGVRRDRS
jgi:aryl-alcohol dehydrogenase-like predicted oxidoreductase